MKLVAGSPPETGHFRFMFAEFVDNRPVLFVYDSIADKWEAMEAEGTRSFEKKKEEDDARVFLNVINGPRESVVVVASTGKYYGAPVVVRPRLEGEGEIGGVGLSMDRLHVYGDGYMMVIRSESEGGKRKNMRVLKGIEMWGLGLEGRVWEYISSVPCEVMKKIERGFGVMMGCLEERNGVIRAALVSNWEGLWDIIWMWFDKNTHQWGCITLPHCNMKAYNLAGITFSSGLTLALP